MHLMRPLHITLNFSQASRTNIGSQSQFWNLEENMNLGETENPLDHMAGPT